jgi:hypothetical protein
MYTLVLLDCNSFSWERKEESLTTLLDQLLMFSNAFTMMSDDNKLNFLSFGEQHWYLLGF